MSPTLLAGTVDREGGPLVFSFVSASANAAKQTLEGGASILHRGLRAENPEDLPTHLTRA